MKPFDHALKTLREHADRLTPEDIEALKQRNPWLAKAAAAKMLRTRREMGSGPMTDDEYRRHREREIRRGR